MTVGAVVFDLGGVITESPMTAFAAYEAEAGLPDGLVRRLNSDRPGHQRLGPLRAAGAGRGRVPAAFEAEAAAAGFTVDAGRVLAALHGDLRPAMVTAVQRLRDAGLPLALLSNNVAPMERTGRLGELLGLFDAVVESSVEGVRKPEPAIYDLALRRLSEAAGREIAAGGLRLPRRPGHQPQAGPGAGHAHHQGGRPGGGAGRAVRR